MTYSTVDLFATNQELASFAEEFAIKVNFHITVINAHKFVVAGRCWDLANEHLDRGIDPDDRIDVILTPTEPVLEGVRQAYDFLEVNRLSSWVSFVFPCVNEAFVLESRVLAYVSDDDPYRKDIDGLVRKVRKSTANGVWAFTGDMKLREFYTRGRRYTSGAKALQDRGARVSTYKDEPQYILGESCPYPLSEVPIFNRKARAV
jgi:hypothetical protein